MKKSGPDYFSMNPLRASSPTASLAADLSQNFHIDQRFVFACDEQGVLQSILTLFLARSLQLPVGLCSLRACLLMRMVMVGTTSGACYKGGVLRLE